LRQCLNAVSTGRSNRAGKQEVEAILILEESLKEYQQSTRLLEDQLVGAYDGEISIELSETRTRCTTLADSIRRRKAALGIDQRAALRELKNSAFLRVRMNARAIKTRIRDRLRQRKFELERLERSYRHAVNGEFGGYGLHRCIQ
jgi:flagellar motility protein MotE (MotC chaperone)